MKASFSNVRIAGVLGVVPERVSHFDDELENYSHSRANSNKLKIAMGYDQHRIAEPGVTTSDLACFGLKYLFEVEGIDPSTIGGIFLVTQTPDYILPPTSAYIHGQFPFSQDVYCVDINDGCNGYIKGLYEGCAFLSVTKESRVLIIAGDVLSSKVSIHDRNSYPLIGDGVTITILEKTNDYSPLDVQVMYDGRGFNKLMIPAGGSRLPCSSITSEMQIDADGNRRSAEHLVMQGRDVFAFTQTVVPDFINSFLTSHDLSVDGVDVFLFHQANSFILDRLRAKLSIPKSKVPDNVIRMYGNSSSGTIPMCISSLPPGNASLKVMACGFGVGLSWGAALFELNNLDFCQIVNF